MDEHKKDKSTNQREEQKLLSKYVVAELDTLKDDLSDELSKIVTKIKNELDREEEE